MKHNDRAERKRGRVRRLNPVTPLIWLTVVAMLATLCVRYMHYEQRYQKDLDRNYYTRWLAINVEEMSYAYCSDTFPISEGRLESDLHVYGQEILKAVMEAGAALMLLDREGNIVESYITDESLALDATRIEIVAGRHNGSRFEMLSDYPDERIRVDDVDMRAALVFDENGRRLNTYLLLNSGYKFGESRPDYNLLFPDVDPLYYQDELYERGYSAKSVKESLEYTEDVPAVVAAKKAAAKAYVDKEKGYFDDAGDLRMMAAYPGDYDNPGDYTLVLIYRMLNRGISSMIFRDDALRVQGERLTLALYLGVVLLIILLALWVFVDARRRDCHPALWGTLTLLGNVIALIIYLIVRTDGTRCPECRTAAKRTYAFCPACGHNLKRICAACGRVLENEWHVCPYCGKSIPDSPDELPNDSAGMVQIGEKDAEQAHDAI